MPTHKECKHFSNGKCKLKNKQVDPDGTACPSFESRGEKMSKKEKMSLQDEFNTLVKEGKKKDEERMKNLSRGAGQGVGGPKQGDGGADECECPECGHTITHKKGTPCVEIKCPKCDTKMVGK